MKKTLTAFGALLLIAMIAACGKTEEEDNLPTDITFTEYSLSGTSCEWINIHDSHNSELISINSDKELENYITCAQGDNHPAIDFSEYTLLLARGVEPYNNSPGNKRFEQISDKHYIMQVNLRPNLAAGITYWHVALIIHKLTGENDINLQITRETD